MLNHFLCHLVRLQKFVVAAAVVDKGGFNKIVGAFIFCSRLHSQRCDEYLEKEEEGAMVTTVIGGGGADEGDDPADEFLECL